MSTPSILRCRRCGWSWGPVGVLPVVPGGPQQLFLRCTSCHRPQVQRVEPDADRDALRCSACREQSLVPLADCPSCGEQDLSWGPLI